MLTKYLDPKNDIAFKKIFGSEKHKNILIHFLNDMLCLEGNKHIKELEFLSTVQDPEIAYKKQSIVDVLCKDGNGVQFIVEMQVKPSRGFEKRAQYYAAKAYCRQLNSGQNDDGKYNNLKEVIFLAILDYVIFPNKPEYQSNHVILDKKSGEHDLKGFSFSFVELPKFNKTDIASLENMVEKWAFFLKYADATHEKDINKLLDSDEIIKEAYEVLNQYNWNEKELLAYEQEIKRIWDNKAVEEYMLEAAEEKGMEKGMEKGKKDRNREIAELMLSRERPIEEIMEFTGLSKYEINALRN